MPKKIEDADANNDNVNENVNENVNNIAKNILYDKCKLSKLNTKTVDSPFFIPHNEITLTKNILEKEKPLDPKQGLTRLINTISLEPIVSHMYHFLDCYKREFTYENFTFFSINEIKRRLKIYRENNQDTICDLATAYYGMGHVIVITWDIINKKYFLRMDGGANDYDRQDNWKFAMNINKNGETDDKIKEKYINPEKLFDIINVPQIEDLCKYFISPAY